MSLHKDNIIKCHMEEGGGLESAKKVSRIIWMPLITNMATEKVLVSTMLFRLKLGGKMIKFG